MRTLLLTAAVLGLLGTASAQGSDVHLTVDENNTVVNAKFKPAAEMSPGFIRDCALKLEPQYSKLTPDQAAALNEEEVCGPKGLIIYQLMTPGQTEAACRTEQQTLTATLRKTDPQQLINRLYHEVCSLEQTRDMMKRIQSL